MIKQLNNLIQRLTGSKRAPTMAELGYHGTGGFGNTLIARAYLPTADELGYHGTPCCGNTLIARTYLPTIEVSTLDDLKESIRELSPLHFYNIKEKLRSGQIITHKTDVTKPELLDYCNNLWIDTVPPIFIFEVTTSR